MTLRSAVELLRRERPDLADALAALIRSEDVRWDTELPDHMWEHDCFDDADEEYRFLRSIIENSPST